MLIDSTALILNIPILDKNTNKFGMKSEKIYGADDALFLIHDYVFPNIMKTPPTDKKSKINSSSWFMTKEENSNPPATRKDRLKCRVFFILN